MKREVSLSKQLPSFKCDLAALGSFVSKTTALFKDEASVSIVVNLRKQKLTFSSVEELKNYVDLPERLTNFELWFRGKSPGPTIWIQSSGLLFYRPEAHVSSNDEVWCVGAMDVIAQSLAAQKTWYSWFAGWVLTISALAAPFFFGLIGGLVKFATGNPLLATPLIAVSWTALYAVLLVLFLFRSLLLPSAVLEIRTTENLVHRYAPELTVLLAVITVLLTIIGWFVK